ncbi:MAG: glycine cleavage system protein GcvH [candidate division FCPU426 bacterium]
MPAPSDRQYTQSHEWIKIDAPGSATVGLSDFAVKAIKDIVFLELPAKGAKLQALKPFGVIESVKAVFDLFAPASGVVADANTAMQEDFETLSKDPYGKGWLLKLSLSTDPLPPLMDSVAYDKFCAESHH